MCPPSCRNHRHFEQMHTFGQTRRSAPTGGRQSGFSLLELLIVLGLMAAAAVLALSTVSNRDNQNRFEETRNKLNIIHKAIVGEPLVLNDQLNINGFVADMGRLPLNLDELLVEPIDCDPDTAGNQSCNWQFDTDTELWHGWNGPYINAIGADYRDGWGFAWDWDDSSVAGALTITSVGLDNDIANDQTGEDAPYTTSSLQTTTIAPSEYAVQLPHTPLHLTVEPAAFCGQCWDRAYDNDPTGCGVAANRTWSTAHQYCVEDTSTSASDCDGIANSVWMPVYGYCSVAPHNSESSCTSAGGTWTPLASVAACATLPTNSFTFTGGEDEFCARPIRINHGQRVSNTHKSTDTSFIDITGAGRQSSTGDDPVYAYQPSMETDAAMPVAGLTLPQGAFRIGLFIHDSTVIPPASQCTNNPYPSLRGQSRSDTITLSSQYPPNIGTLTHPIKLQWRSQ